MNFRDISKIDSFPRDRIMAVIDGIPKGRCATIADVAKESRAGETTVRKVAGEVGALRRGFMDGRTVALVTGRGAK